MQFRDQYARPFAAQRPDCQVDFLARRRNTPIAVRFLDLDGFKYNNDSPGIP
jgi:hypothetical protein